jgi:hypothetical protein
MKSVLFKNPVNGEKFICDDVNNIKTIEGIEYLTVHRPNNERQFLMRKDVLKKIDTVKKDLFK